MAATVEVLVQGTLSRDAHFSVVVIQGFEQGVDITVGGTAFNADGTLPDRVLIVDVFKEYPIGDSRSWVPRAIELDGLQVIPLLEAPQGRVLQISPQERHAGRLP